MLMCSSYLIFFVDLVLKYLKYRRDVVCTIYYYCLLRVHFNPEVVVIRKYFGFVLFDFVFVFFDNVLYIRYQEY